MKTYLRLFTGCAIIILFGYINSYSQSLQFEQKTETVKGALDQTTGITSYAVIKNISTTPINIYAKLVIVSLTPGHKIQFCWDQCYPPKNVNFTSGQTIVIQPGATNEPAFPFDPALIPNNVVGTSIVQFVFYNASNVNDSIAYTITYNITETDVNDPQVAVANPCTISPNPAVDYINLNFDQQYVGSYQNADIFSVAGVLTMTVSLNDLNVVNIPVAGLNEGVYYCRLTGKSGKALFVPFVISR
jgi:hypothetical protein